VRPHGEGQSGSEEEHFIFIPDVLQQQQQQQQVTCGFTGKDSFG